MRLFLSITLFIAACASAPRAEPRPPFVYELRPSLEAAIVVAHLRAEAAACPRVPALADDLAERDRLMLALAHRPLPVPAEDEGERGRTFHRFQRALVDATGRLAEDPMDPTGPPTLVELIDLIIVAQAPDYACWAQRTLVRYSELPCEWRDFEAERLAKERGPLLAALCPEPGVTLDRVGIVPEGCIPCIGE